MMGLLLWRGVQATLGAEPEVLRTWLGRMAEGDLAARLDVPARANDSVFSAMARMQQQMGAIVGQVRKVADFIGEISSSATDQRITIGSVSDAVGNLDMTTQQNAALVEQSAAAAESLKHQAHMLAQLVSRFRVSDHAGLSVHT